MTNKLAKAGDMIVMEKFDEDIKHAKTPEFSEYIQAPDVWYL